MDLSPYQSDDVNHLHASIYAMEAEPNNSLLRRFLRRRRFFLNAVKQEALNLMNDPIVKTLADAVEAGHTVTITYKDVEREIEPYAVGFDAHGNGLLRGFQISPEEGWKLMRTDRIQKVLHCSNPIIVVRPEYRRDDKAMKKIEAQL